MVVDQADADWRHAHETSPRKAALSVVWRHHEERDFHDTPGHAAHGSERLTRVPFTAPGDRDSLPPMVSA